MKMKIAVVDGQGGGIGRSFIEQLKRAAPHAFIFAAGTNRAATEAMIRAGADDGGTGDNAVITGARDADIIVGPIGIILSGSMKGELTYKMARAVSESKARKILIPMNRCNVEIVGVSRGTLLGELVSAAVSSVMCEMNPPSA